MLHEVKDRDPRGLVTRKLDYGAITTFSEEIQTEKTEMDQYDSTIDQLQNELNQAKDSNQVGVDETMNTKEQEDRLQLLNEELQNTMLQARSTYDHRFTAKQEMEENFDRQNKALAE